MADDLGAAPSLGGRRSSWSDIAAPSQKERQPITLGRSQRRGRVDSARDVIRKPSGSQITSSVLKIWVIGRAGPRESRNTTAGTTPVGWIEGGGHRYSKAGKTCPR